MDRRQFMGAAAAAAFARYEGKDHGPEDIDEWGPIDWRDFEQVAWRELWGQAHFGHAGLSLEHKDAVEEVTSEVWYNEQGIFFTIDGRGEAGDLNFAATIEPEHAKELAAILFQAAWEFEQRTRE